jgi:hypothetical protein
MNFHTKKNYLFSYTLYITGFVMTINRKHHIELMTVKRSKKKVVLKLKKLRHLMLEMRVSTSRVCF